MSEQELYLPRFQKALREIDDLLAQLSQKDVEIAGLRAAALAKKQTTPWIEPIPPDSTEKPQ